MTQRCRLYLITPPLIDLDDFAPVFEQTLAAGDVACVQLRLKDVSRDEIVAAAERLIPLAHNRDVAFLLNDDPELTLQVNADGVHLGQGDMPCSEARRVLGDDRIIGVTCHNSRHLAMVAGEAGADYVAFGAFFPSRTKPARFTAAPELLQWWNELFEIPAVAIGGINVDNCPPLISAGADFLAVSEGVWSYPDGPAEAVKAFNAKMSDVS